MHKKFDELNAQNGPRLFERPKVIKRMKYAEVGEDFSGWAERGPACVQWAA